MYGLTGMEQPLLYLVRHGATVANEANRFRGQLDYPLDEDGLAAAEEAAHWLCFQPIGFVASSPLRRAVQTANYIAPAVGLDIFDRNPGLLPWNIGPTFAGKPRDEKHKAELQRYIDDPALVPPDGESLDFHNRRFADTLYRYIAQASYQQPGVLITHSSGIAAARKALDPDFQPDGTELVEPGGIVAVYIGADDTKKLVPVLGEVISDEEMAAS